jgi:hypothetical protein
MGDFSEKLLFQSKSDLTLVILINWGRGYVYITSTSFDALCCLLIRGNKSTK